MKNKLLKYYLVVSCLFSTVLLLAQTPPAPIDPPNEDDLPIDDYIVLLVIIGVVYAFMRFRAIQAKNAKIEDAL